jgi:hypothetical protein
MSRVVLCDYNSGASGSYHSHLSASIPGLTRADDGIQQFLISAHVHFVVYVRTYTQLLGSEVFTAVVMKSSIFWDITPCRIWGFHSGDYEEFYLLGYNVVECVERQSTFRGNMSPLSWRPKNAPSKNPAWKRVARRAAARCCIPEGRTLLELLFEIFFPTFYYLKFTWKARRKETSRRM